MAGSDFAGYIVPNRSGWVSLSELRWCRTATRSSSPKTRTWIYLGIIGDFDFVAARVEMQGTFVDRYPVAHINNLGPLDDFAIEYRD